MKAELGALRAHRNPHLESDQERGLKMKRIFTALLSFCHELYTDVKKEISVSLSFVSIPRMFLC